MSRQDPHAPPFKSRFSLSSLLPTRHPPLLISQPRAIIHPCDLPTRSISRQHTLSSTSSGPYPRIISQYASPLTSYPDTPIIPEPATPPRRRPLPIDLKRIKAAYPVQKAINDAPGDRDFGTPSTPSPISPFSSYGRREQLLSPPPILPPLPAVKNGKKDRKEKDDPFDIAIVESGHRYDSWKGGKVDIRPGESIPKGLVGSYIGPGRRGTIRGEEGEQVYDSVLQHVLLTPTYLRSSPSSTHHTIGKREAMVERAKRMSRFVPMLPSAMRREDPAARAIRDMRDREDAEMDRFRKVHGGESKTALVSPIGKGVSPGWIGQKEKVGRSYEKYGIKGKGAALRKYESRERRRNCWGWGSRKRSKDEMDNMGRSKRFWIKYRFLGFVLLLVIAAIVLAAVFLTRKPNQTATTTSDTSTTPTQSINPTQSANSSPSQSLTGSQSLNPSSTISSPAPSSTSRTLQTCLDNFSSTSSISPFPCSDCTPLLLGTVNDFSTPLVNGNSTGVGAALQYCTLLDVMAAGNSASFEGLGWKGKGTCTWSGVKCDPRGRVTELSLTYPNVPYRFPTTIGQIPTLTILRIKGNSSVPSGPFPASIINPSLVTLDISDTALQGPIASIDFSKATGLMTVYLANNPILGSAVPDFKNNGRLLTLAMTGQLLGDANEGGLPSSLTYLDLSYNSLLSQIPSFSTLTGLKTLYLESNQYVTAPSALPLSLTDLKLNNNPSLRGSIPLATCGNPGLASCDLRNTGLGGAGANGTRSCGRCLF